MNWYWLALGWAVCGFLAYGRTLAFFQKGWLSVAGENRNVDRSIAFILALGGPLGFIATLLICHYGFMWRLPRRKDG